MLEPLNLRDAVRAQHALRPKAMMPGYDAATTTRRTKNWSATTADINTLVFGNLETLRARARDQARRNPFAKKGVDSFVSNCVGAGIKPQSLHPDARMRQKIHELWNDWMEDADADGLVDFYGMQAVVAREIVESGECLVRLRPRLPQDGLAVPLQLQGLEAEHLPVWRTELEANGNITRAGIECDAIGRRVAYHLYRVHPGDVMNPLFTAALVRIPASFILHQFQPLRFGQMRGQPWLCSVLMKLFELDQYDDAELVRKKVAAMFAGFIQKERPEADFLPGEQNDPDNPGGAVAGLEPGTLQVLLPGETITFSNPAEVGTAYETFMRVQLRAVASGIGCTYEQLTGDLTGVNYSSIRAGLLEFRRALEQLQFQVVVFQFCRPVWRAWIKAALLAGALDADPSDAGLYRVKWVPPGFDWVDPLKDVKAQVMAVRAGFRSRSDVIVEQGFDAEQVDREIAADNERADELGLQFDSDGRAPAASGQEQAVPGAGEGDKQEETDKPGGER